METTFYILNIILNVIGFLTFIGLIFTGMLLYNLFKYDKKGNVVEKIHTLRECKKKIHESFIIKTIVPIKILGFSEIVGSTIYVNKESFDRVNIGDWVEYQEKEGGNNA